MKHQDGIISMLTTIMVSILLITLALGLLILTNAGTQQASDDELSLRAYAAAESGIEWAFGQFQAGTTYNNCTVGATAVSAVFPATHDNAITCLTVTNIANHLKGTLNASNENQIVFTQGSLPGALKNIQVNWLLPTDADFWRPIYPPWPGGQLGQLQPSAIPGVELTLVDFTSLAANSVNGGVNIRNVAFLPTGGATSITPKKVLAHCTPGPPPASAPYNCSATIPVVSPGGGELVYIRSLYFPPVSASVLSYSLCFQDITGTCMDVPQQTAEIDVTARSGPVFRRIVAVTPPGNGPLLAGLNYVLFGDQSICKDFDIETSGINSFCGPSSP